MSVMESFYGGRQGASFVIVKRFDGLDIPENTYYRCRWFAQDEEGYFYVPLIERNASNYKDYPHWGIIKCDGSTTVTSKDGEVSSPLDKEYQEGMRQCFAKGGASTSEVNYGEYVIIDTIAGLGEYSNPDNGKVYRRGMNYDYNAITNPLCGAEYIGQVLGPQGATPELEMDTVQTVLEHPESSFREYTPQEGDSEDGIVPGRYFDNNVEKYNDTIDYAWATVRDNNGNITGAMIGFTFPYLIPEVSGSWRKPYYTQEDYDLGRIADSSLIGKIIPYADDFDLFIDNGLNTSDRDPNHGDTGHPFYRKWKLNIPKGIKGDTQTDLEIYPTKITDGAIIYNNVSSSGTLSEPRAVPAENLQVDLTNYETTKEKGYVKVAGGGYAYLTDTRGLRMRYLETRYDNLEAGENEWIDIGEYNTITRVSLSEDGWLTVFYTWDDPQTLEEVIRWIKYSGDTEADGIQFDDDGTVTIIYNTLDEFGQNQKQIHPNLISWVNSTTLAKDGHYKVIYNNDNNHINKTGTEDGKAVYETDLTWPTQVSLDAEGVLKFLYNNNLLDDIYPDPWGGEGTIDRTEGSYKFIIPWLEKVKLLEDGHFNFKFNNNKLYDNSDPDWNEDEVTYEPRITWVTRVTLTDNGDLKIYFNNDMNKSSTLDSGDRWISDATGEYYTKHLTWIQKVNIDDDGVVHFYYNDGTEMTPLVVNKVKYIDHAYIDTDDNGGTIPADYATEGAGDQRLHIVYNTKDTEGNNEEDIIGRPINYIVESVVTAWNSMTSNTEANHLLVYYSDPEYRAWLATNYPDKIKTYQGTKDSAPKEGWFDLGYVRGEPGGLHIIGNTSDASTLVGLKPEDVMHNPEHAGWAMTVGDPSSAYEIYVYDYTTDNWYSIGTIDAERIDPRLIIDKNTEADGAPDLLNKYGYWLVTDTRKFAL